jgi:hypothetical protein
VLNIPWPLKMHGGACRRSTWDGVDMQVEVVGGQVEEIGQERGFWPQEADTEHTSSISPGH